MIDAIWPRLVFRPCEVSAPAALGLPESSPGQVLTNSTYRTIVCTLKAVLVLIMLYFCSRSKPVPDSIREDTRAAWAALFGGRWEDRARRKSTYSTNVCTLKTVLVADNALLLLAVKRHASGVGGSLRGRLGRPGEAELLIT